MSELPLPSSLHGAVAVPSLRWHQRARERLHARWQAWRDHLLTSPAFRRCAARNPLMRPMARRRASELFDLVSGFVYTQVLLACVRLDLFERLAQGPLTAAELSRAIEVPLHNTERLLAAALSLDLVEHRAGDRYGLGKLGAPMVANPALHAMVEHHAILYADLQDPVALLRGDIDHPALSRYWAYANAEAPGALQPDQVDPYSALMSASQPLVADEVLDTIDLRGFRCLLDVGGGQGRFLIAAAQRAPALQLMLFDLPGVVPAARAALDAAGLAARAVVHGGDFVRDPLPRGADLISLVRVAYDHPDDRALQLLRAVHDALPPGGTLLLAEPMADAAGATRMGDAYFGFYLLAMQGGRPRSAGQLTRMVEAAGFEGVREHATPLPLQVGLLTARRPLAQQAQTKSI